MPLNKFYIKKWFRMLSGKSILHVSQGVGYYYSKDEIDGYYNDLREKVLKSNLNGCSLPLTELPNGDKIEFPIAIFQYGLGAYDLYIETKQKKYYDIFIAAINWAVSNQKKEGGWVAFENECINNPYSSMAQGEGISLLVRGYQETNEKKYLELASKALEFLKKDINSGGCTLYEKDKIILKEFPEKPTVLNGWIFSLFGVYDYYLITKNKKELDFFKKSINSLKNELEKFDNGYWSMYDSEKKISSPFYHKLHIALLDVLYELTSEKTFKDYSLKFSKYQSSFLCRSRSFIKKSWQKIIER